MGRVAFSYVRIMGDNHLNVGTTRIDVGQAGFEAIIDGFNSGCFQMTTTFRFYNFGPQITPLLFFAGSLANNPTLQTIGFARNNLNEDQCAAIIQ